MDAKFSIIGFALLILLISGCVDNSEINDFAVDQIQNGDAPDETPDVIPDKVKEPEAPIFSPPYVCDKEIVQEALEPVFGSEMRVSRISSFGGPINLAKCNILVNSRPIIQFEFVKYETFERAFDFMRDQEIQYLSAVKDFERSVESITPNSLSFVSLKTGENRIIFIDEDPAAPAVVKVKSFPGDTASVETLREVSVALEVLLR